MNLNRYIRRLLQTPSNNIFIQLFRYTFVGGIAFAVDFSLLAFLTELFHIPYLLSACISFIAGLTTNYCLSIKWVFNQSNEHDALRDFILFAIVGVAGLGLNTLIMWFSTEIMGLHYLFSKIISTIIVFVWNFIGRRVAINKMGAMDRIINRKI
jgi:hypothetical protein